MSEQGTPNPQLLEEGTQSGIEYPQHQQKPQHQATPNQDAIPNREPEPTFSQQPRMTPVTAEGELQRWRTKRRVKSDIGGGGNSSWVSTFWNALPRANQTLLVLAALMFCQGVKVTFISPWWQRHQEEMAARRWREEIRQEEARAAQEEAARIESGRIAAEEREALARQEAERQSEAERQAEAKRQAQEQAALGTMPDGEVTADGENMHDTTEPLDSQDVTSDPYATNGEENIGVGENEEE